MPEDNNNKPEDNKPLAGDSPDGKGTVDPSSELSLKDINETLGKDFKDKETALKALKDTSNYVGKAGKFEKAVKSVMAGKKMSEEEAIKYIQDQAATQPGGEIDESQFVKREDFNKESFYNNNPDYRPYQRIVENFKKAHPEMPRADIIQSEDFKEDFDKIKAHDTAEKQKSVLQSNPRLGAVKDKMTKAKEAMNEGKQGDAEKAAVDAVCDQYPIKKE